MKSPCLVLNYSDHKTPVALCVLPTSCSRSLCPQWPIFIFYLFEVPPCTALTYSLHCAVTEYSRLVYSLFSSAALNIVVFPSLQSCSSSYHIVGSSSHRYKLSWTRLQSIVLYWAALHCTDLHCTALHYTAHFMLIGSCWMWIEKSVKCILVGAETEV